MASAALYTPQVLELATGLAHFRRDTPLPLIGDARSRACGSTISVGLEVDPQGRISDVSVASQACAIGQASAAIFAHGARGRNAAEIRSAFTAMQAWLDGSGPQPDWPGIEAIAAAREYPGRHGAILLAWQAASEILPSA